MSTSEVLDTVPEFENLWREIRRFPVRVQVEEWARFYGARWPELFVKQTESYRSSRVSWRRVAETRVFPNLPARWSRIVAARRSLRSVIPSVDARVRARLGFRHPVVHILHVGIGCGAGWATKYGGRPAILYGLENAAELGWTGSPRLAAHVAHELAHLAHSDLRERAGRGGLERVRGAYGQLYVEGFATRMEAEGLGRSRSGGSERDIGWSRWCRDHEGELASRFLGTVRRHRSVRRFFGSWYQVGGHVETGYWLGERVIRSWESSRTLREIATLPQRSIRVLVGESLRAGRWRTGAARPDNV
ncbi:MAG: M48 family metallopeptidase [Thermoplasmata archaeon]|nr:M48 family metallopeptidase [Thermoplasmata archaeon]